MERSYPSSAEEFELSVLELADGRGHELNPNNASICILLCTRGRAVLSCERNEKTTIITKGESVLIPAALTGLSISGKATLYKAAVNSRFLM